MRIIAGEWRGRPIQAPSNAATRPTADRVRQALFDMLSHAAWGGPDLLTNASVLDGFAGSGALGLEALSRGAIHAVFVEQNRPAASCLHANIASLQAQSRSTVVTADIRRIRPRPAAQPPCGLIFLDPPYGLGLLSPALAALAAGGWIAPGAIVVLECAAAEPDPIPPPAVGVLASRRAGAAKLVFTGPW